MLTLSNAQTPDDLLSMSSEYEERQRVLDSLSYNVGCALTDADVRRENEKARVRARRENKIRHRRLF